MAFRAGGYTGTEQLGSATETDAGAPNAALIVDPIPSAMRYKMIGFNGLTPVPWEVFGEPDFTGALAPTPGLTGIRISLQWLPP